jgi:hypothetical protein
MRLEAEATTNCVGISLPASHHDANASAANLLGLRMIIADKQTPLCSK